MRMPVAVLSSVGLTSCFLTTASHVLLARVATAFARPGVKRSLQIDLVSPACDAASRSSIALATGFLSPVKAFSFLPSLSPPPPQPTTIRLNPRKRVATVPRTTVTIRCGRLLPCPRSAARRDAVRVEDRLDAAQALDACLQRAGVPHLDDEAVLDHRVHDGAARLQDVHAALGERPRQVLKETRAVPSIDLKLHAERGRPLPLPRHVGEALRV